MKTETLQKINSITLLIIELKLQPLSVETKKTIQKLQQELDMVIKGKDEL
tara:strand:- start:1040 stop:1189 length:150 start_codon:yes stop_codon:yes gene_type:complete